MAAIDRATFLDKARNFKREELTVDGLGTMFVREVSAFEAREQNKRNSAADSDELTTSAWLVAQVVCDEGGARLLTDADIDALKTIPIRVLKAIGDKSAELSGAKKKDVSTTPASGSHSTSAAS